MQYKIMFLEEQFDDVLDRMLGDKVITKKQHDYYMNLYYNEKDYKEDFIVNVLDKVRNINIVDLLTRVGDALLSMINYADDGMIPRGDPNYRDFFNDIDMANDMLKELCVVRDYIKEYGVDVLE